MNSSYRKGSPYYDSLETLTEKWANQNLENDLTQIKAIVDRTFKGVSADKKADLVLGIWSKLNDLSEINEIYIRDVAYHEVAIGIHEGSQTLSVALDGSLSVSADASVSMTEYP